MSGFIGFPPRDEILAALQRIGELRSIGHAPVEGEGRVSGDRKAMFTAIADRLDSRVYDAAAFSFILMEVLHEHEDQMGADLSRILREVIVALTGDESLAGEAVDAFNEIHQMIAS